MTNPIGSAHPNSPQQAALPARPQQAPQQPKSTLQQQDTVTLKSTGDVNHDGDSK